MRIHAEYAKENYFVKSMGYWEFLPQKSQI